MASNRTVRRLLICLLVLAALTGCSAGYLWQAALGQLELMQARRPIDTVLADAATGAELRRRLELVAAARVFAHGELGLPDNGSYRDYADLHRPFAVWNVFAAPAFSLQLRTSCFPVAGCVGYRGYFREEAARGYAASLAAEGYDVWVAGAPAYSTLGYFHDPVLSTVMGLPDWQLPGFVFHELAHQLLYVPGDTTFSESFAMAVEEAGLGRWLAARDDRQASCSYARLLARRAALQVLLADTRRRLDELYAGAGDEAARHAAKDALLAEFGAGWRRIRDEQGGERGGAMAFNNAALGALAAYDEDLPAFRLALAGVDGDLPAFYAEARRLAALTPGQRRSAMTALVDRAAGGR